MKRILVGFLTIFILAIVAAFVLWMNRASCVAEYLSRHLHVPVTLQSLTLSKTEANLTQLWIGNPKQSQTSTAFTTEQVSVLSTVDQVLANPLVIDEIDISNIFVGIEYYPDGHTNWGIILGGEKQDTKPGRDYLIRTLVLTNLTIVVTQANGQRKQYPTLARMEFHNISSDTGFPISEIEKAIFNQMMKDLLKQLNLQDLFKQIPMPKNSPLQYWPF